jgi:hypothetical protein
MYIVFLVIWVTNLAQKTRKTNYKCYIVPNVGSKIDFIKNIVLNSHGALLYYLSYSPTKIIAR